MLGIIEHDNNSKGKLRQKESDVIYFFDLKNKNYDYDYYKLLYYIIYLAQEIWLNIFDFTLDFDVEEMGNMLEEKGLRKAGDKEHPALYRNSSNGILLENSDPNSYEIGTISV